MKNTYTKNNWCKFYPDCKFKAGKCRMKHPDEGNPKEVNEWGKWQKK